MKTSLLLATAILLASASYAQQAEVKTKEAGAASVTTSKKATDAKTQASSSSAVKVKTDATDGAKDQAVHAKKEIKSEATAEKVKAKDQTTATVKETRETVKENSEQQASVKADANAKATSKNNKVSQDASLNNHETVSTEAGKKTAQSLNEKGQSELKSGTSKTAKTTTHVKTEINNDAIKAGDQTKTAVKKAGPEVKRNAAASSTTAVKSGAAIQHPVKPKTSMKM